jgi:hypothetical protein
LVRHEVLSPNQYGCYGIFGADHSSIYIGKGDIRTRLLAHLGGDNPCIIRSRPLVFYAMVTPNTDDEEKRLILEFSPCCNERIG